MIRKILYIAILLTLIFGGTCIFLDSKESSLENELLNVTTKEENLNIVFLDNAIQVEINNNQIDNIINTCISNNVVNNAIEKSKKESSKTKDVEKVIESKNQERKQIEKEVVVETVQEISIQKVEEEPRKVEESTDNKEETMKQEETKTESKSEEKTSQNTNIPTEEYKYNEEMTYQIINIINSNPSSFMISDGYNVVVDSSIINLTNQFTFSEVRVKNAITYKAGTIRVYARDYYYNGQFLFTECYII